MSRATVVSAACLVAGLSLQPRPSLAVGGTGGTAFTIQCDGSEKVGAILVRAGRRVDNIGIECHKTGSKRVFKAGGSGGVERRFAFDVVDSYVIAADVAIGKCGKKTTRVCGVRFLAKGGGWTPFYGDETRDVRSFAGPLDQAVQGRVFELYGFKGRSGAEVDNLEPLFRVRNTPAPHRSEAIGARKLADALNVVLGQMELHLHNWGERHGDSWLREDAAWVKFRAANFTRRFTIPEASFRRKGGLWRRYFYVNDIDSRQIDLQFERDRSAFVLRIGFEGQGAEIKGLCRYKKPNGDYTRCPGDSDGDQQVPDVEWSHPAVDVTLIPSVYDRDGLNGIALRAQNARVLGDFQLGGLCGSVQGECKSLLGDWEGKLRVTVEAELTAALNRDDVRRAQARAARVALDAAGITGRVTKAYVSGGDVRIEH